MPATADDRALKAGQADNFDALNRVVEGTPYDRHLRFMNFGFVALGDDVAMGPRLGPAFPNRESAQLLFQVIGDADLQGRRVLEVGCGRGGNLWLVDRYYGSGHVVGLDIAGLSVAYAARSQDPTAAGFVQGDAERLPFAEGSTDALLSIETSCTYPDLGRFFGEVARVIRPGGWFLYTDMLDRGLHPALARALDAAGFDMVERRDITANVRAARDGRAARQQLAFGPPTGGDAPVFDEFVAAGGSTLHRYLAGDERLYHLFRMRRRPGPVPDVALFDEAERALIRAGAADTVELLTLPSPSGQ